MNTLNTDAAPGGHTVEAMPDKTVSVNGRRRRKSVSCEQHFRLRKPTQPSTETVSNRALLYPETVSVANNNC